MSDSTIQTTRLELRPLTLGDVQLWGALGHLAYLLAFIAVGMTAAYYSYRRRSSIISRRNPRRRGGSAFPWKTFQVRTTRGKGA